MEFSKISQLTAVKNARRTHPVLGDRVAAGLAVVAWLALAGDAFAQEANQWAPLPEGQPAAPQPVPSTQVWSNGAQPGVPVFAPDDLSQRLAGAVATPAPLPAPQTTAQQAPVYAPAALAASAPVPAPAQTPATQPMPNQAYGAAPGFASGYGPGYGSGYGGMPGMAPGFAGQPYGAGLAGLAPFPGGGFGQPGGYPYGGGFGPGYGTGYGPGYGYGFGNNAPSSNIWGGPNNNYNSYSGMPFFGGSPFGFW